LLILAVVRLYLTRIDTQKEVARKNKNLQKIKVRFAIFKNSSELIFNFNLKLKLIYQGKSEFF